MPNSSITANVDAFAEILRWGRFSVPMHQRPYAWKPDNVQSLLEDMADCIASKRPHHFLGTIMLIPGKHQEWAIDDGQQRIITFILIVARLCKLFNESGDSHEENLAMRIVFDIPGGRPVTLEDANDLKPRASLLVNDEMCFHALICGKSIKKNGALSSAGKTIDSFLALPEYSSPKWRKTLLKFMLNQVKSSWVEFKNPDDAIPVFETQNARGKPLEPVQLACAYFYSCLRGYDDKTKIVYTQIESIRTKLNNDEGRLFNYVRCVTQGLYGYLSSDRYYRDLKKAMPVLPPKKRADAVQELVQFLSAPRNIGIFQILTQTRTNEEILKQLTKDAGKSGNYRTMSGFLNDLRLYSGVSNAVMFALLCKYMDSHDTPEKRKVAKFVYLSSKLFASFIQRAAHSFDGAFSPSRFERGIADMALKIINGEIHTVSEFHSALVNLDKNKNIIPDNLYRERMRSLSFPRKSATAKYILARINESEQIPLDVADDKSTLEHILPHSKSHLEGWDFKKEEHALYVHRLGNLTLLKSKDNHPSLPTNANFKEKKKVFQQSSYSITQKISRGEEWNIKSINRRQADLAKAASRVWNFDI